MVHPRDPELAEIGTQPLAVLSGGLYNAAEEGILAFGTFGCTHSRWSPSPPWLVPFYSLTILMGVTGYPGKSTIRVPHFSNHYHVIHRPRRRNRWLPSAPFNRGPGALHTDVDHPFHFFPCRPRHQVFRNSLPRLRGYLCTIPSARHSARTKVAHLVPPSRKVRHSPRQALSLSTSTHTVTRRRHYKCVSFRTAFKHLYTYLSPSLCFCPSSSLW